MRSYPRAGASSAGSHCQAICEHHRARFCRGSSHGAIAVFTETEHRDLISSIARRLRSTRFAASASVPPDEPAVGGSPCCAAGVTADEMLRAADRNWCAAGVKTGDVLG